MYVMECLLNSVTESSFFMTNDNLTSVLLFHVGAGANATPAPWVFEDYFDWGILFARRG